jgi:hypothetical protein
MGQQIATFEELFLLPISVFTSRIFASYWGEYGGFQRRGTFIELLKTLIAAQRLALDSGRPLRRR